MAMAEVYDVIGILEVEESLFQQQKKSLKLCKKKEVIIVGCKCLVCPFKVLCIISGGSMCE